MSVTAFQGEILRRLARQRRERGESYVAGGVALNMLLAAPRRSRDIGVFHDTEVALAATGVCCASGRPHFLVFAKRAAYGFTKAVSAARGLSCAGEAETVAAPGERLNLDGAV